MPRSTSKYLPLLFTWIGKIISPDLVSMSVITTVDIFERHSVRSVKVDYLGSKEVDLGIDFVRKSGFGLRLFCKYDGARRFI